MSYVAKTEIGYHRKMNQDAYCCLHNQHQDLLILVCDGIGGSKAGEVASRETIHYFAEHFPKNDGFLNLLEARHYLREYVQKANEHVKKMASDNPDYEGMGTTITGLFFSENGILSLNVGDSRCYGFKDQCLHALTEDDSLVAEMLKMGEITYEESLTHPKRHYLTKAIGIWPHIEANIQEVGEYSQFLVCSDGLHGYVTDAEITEILKDPAADIQMKAENLKNIALEKGGYDNITFVLLEQPWQK